MITILSVLECWQSPLPKYGIIRLYIDLEMKSAQLKTGLLFANHRQGGPN